MADFIVTTIDDTVADDGVTSLREALVLADASAGADTITFDAGLSGQTITLDGNELFLTSDVIIDGDIDGDDVADITISGNSMSRVFNAVSGMSTLNALTITEGDDSGFYVASGATVDLTNSTVSGNSEYFDGGGIHNRGTLSVTNSTISGNSAWYGGGIGNHGTLVVENSTISNNFSLTGGGIFNNGTMALTNSTISGNTAFFYFGGGIDNRGTMTLANSTLSGNDAMYGGGIYNRGSATMTNSIVLGNYAYLGAEVFGGVSAANSLTGAGGETAADVFAALDGSGGLLADNGGPVQTIALRADLLNPALDAGDDTAAPATDAAGQARLDILDVANNGANISDLGVLELQSSSSPGSNGPDLIIGTNVAETLTGNGGNDIIYGLGGRDTINGNLGNDQLFGGNGRDVMLGGSGADRIDGGLQDDDLQGGSGNDVLLGGNGVDLIQGGDGNDRVAGGLGADLLYGGADNDTFIYQTSDDSLTGAGADRIFDFVQGEDVLNFRAVSPTVFDFVGTSVFTGDGPEIRIIEAANGNTSIFADLDGDTIADMRVVVIGVTGLTESDFLL